MSGNLNANVVLQRIKKSKKKTHNNTNKINKAQSINMIKIRTNLSNGESLQSVN